MRSDVRVSVMGSREQLCLHNKVSQLKGVAQNHACKGLVQSRQCSYHHNVQCKPSVTSTCVSLCFLTPLSPSSFVFVDWLDVAVKSTLAPQVLDIEDLAKLGHDEHVWCVSCTSQKKKEEKKETRTLAPPSPPSHIPSFFFSQTD